VIDIGFAILRELADKMTDPIKQLTRPIVLWMVVGSYCAAALVHNTDAVNALEPLVTTFTAFWFGGRAALRQNKEGGNGSREPAEPTA